MGFVIFIGVEIGFIFEGESIRGQKSVRFNFVCFNGGEVCEKIFCFIGGKVCDLGSGVSLGLIKSEENLLHQILKEDLRERGCQPLF